MDISFIQTDSTGNISRSDSPLYHVCGGRKRISIQAINISPKIGQTGRLSMGFDPIGSFVLFYRLPGQGGRYSIFTFFPILLDGLLQFGEIDAAVLVKGGIFRYTNGVLQHLGNGIEIHPTLPDIEDFI